MIVPIQRLRSGDLHDSVDYFEWMLGLAFPYVSLCKSIIEEESMNKPSID
jgi:hypothetical protein